MNSWIKVVTHPLGLAGFALFLVFSFLAKSRQGKKPKWATPSAFAMALVALLGGLSLAHQQNTHPTVPSTEQKIGVIQQSSSGSSTSNVAGVQGNVSVNINQPNPSNQSSSGPLTEEDILSRLRAGSNSKNLIGEIENRGVAFEMTPERANTLRVAGATQAILDAIEKNPKK